MSINYIGMEVHLATIVVVVLDPSGRTLMETLLATEAATVVDFLHGLRAPLYVTSEAGTMSEWLYELFSPRVAKAVVCCDPSKNALLKKGNKNDRIDARKLAEWLGAGLLSPVRSRRDLSERAETTRPLYLSLTKDATRVMNRLKASS